jgi:hypothetical protein
MFPVIVLCICLKGDVFFFSSLRFTTVIMVTMPSLAYPYGHDMSCIYVPFLFFDWWVGSYPRLPMESHMSRGSGKIGYGNGESVSPCRVPLCMYMHGGEVIARGRVI